MGPSVTLSSPPQPVSKSALLQLRTSVQTAVTSGKHRFYFQLLVPLIAVALASGVRFLLAPILYDRAAFLLFTLAVMVSAWIGGRRMGMLATVLASVAGIWLFVKPFNVASIHDMQDGLQIILFALTGCGISYLAGELQEARRASQKQALAAASSRDELVDLVESISEGFQAFDSEYKLKFMNRAAQRILKHSTAELTGEPIWSQFPAIIGGDVKDVLRSVMLERHPATCENFYESWQSWFAINVYPFRDGISVLFRDISDRKKGQQEREQLIRELQDALANVRTLRGLIPICASCKKIRDDRGYWNQIEIYIRNHSEADFSHGLCPECVENYFPE
jgi:K+-sensing histidine kinase KdpD